MVLTLPDTGNTMYCLIVQSAVHKVRTHEQLGSELFTEWHWSPKYYSVNPDTIVSPCFVISCKHDLPEFWRLYHMMIGRITLSKVLMAKDYRKALK